MTSVTREAIRQMKKYNPYNEETGDRISYNEIYEAMNKLACLSIISSDEWKRIYELDNKLFQESLKAAGKPIPEDPWVREI